MSQISSQNILLRGGTLLIHDKRGHVVSEVLDLLIEGSAISKIEKSIQLTDAEARNTKILSCEGKIISPGFINTHQHLFQTQIKGKIADCNLAKFFTCANTFAANYDAKDAFWGQLCGALENVDAGTTTVVDHGNPNLAEHSGTLVQALAVSGLRTIFCYSPGVQHDYTSPHALSEFQQLAAEVRNGNGRVTMGYAMDNIFLPQDILTAHYRAIRAAGAKLITTHGASGPPFGNRPSALQLLHQHALLGPDVLVSHANYPKEHDSALLRATGASISTTPSIELQTGLSPVALMPEFCNHSSLGTDGNGWSTAYMPGEMGMLLQHARWSRAQDLARDGKWSASVGPQVEEVFNLATTAGAKAVGMADEVGRLAVGFKADILVFDGNSPGMFVAARESPLAAVVLHSSIRDLQTVIIDGIIRKEGGRLLDVEVEGPSNSDLGISEGQRLNWEGVRREVAKSCHVLQERVDEIDMGAAEEMIMDAFGMDKQSLVL